LGHGVGPFYKAPDEAKSLVWLRAFLLWEEDSSLHLAPGAPRAWFAPEQSFGVRRLATWFGPVTYQVRSGLAEVTVEVVVPDRRPLQALLVHVRRPAGQIVTAVTVNGEAREDFDPTAEVVSVAAPSGTVIVQIAYGDG
jgi:hypothetical protein